MDADSQTFFVDLGIDRWHSPCFVGFQSNSLILSFSKTDFAERTCLGSLFLFYNLSNRIEQTAHFLGMLHISYLGLSFLSLTQAAKHWVIESNCYKAVMDAKALPRARGAVMTAHEIWELKEKQQVLRLAQERMAIDDGYDGYMIHEDYLTYQGRLDKKIKPEASKKLYEKSKQPAEAFVTDVDRYEEIQTPNGPTMLGAMDCQA
ncbi:hypothetical protein O181_103414 [Austropuccinia psidii MF-1]|uniref:Uncharacterized protein n=1 Tax=Austropuccinia psidii MF-1 TaxID=1389203 RepID=A0A9Q3JKG0_9BASI|nr:hypothetical protein [Austropuccinia psidii MF-1]